MVVAQWVPTQTELRVHPTAKLIARRFIDHPGQEFRWECQGDTAIKWGHASTMAQAQIDAMAWWEQFVVANESMKIGGGV